MEGGQSGTYLRLTRASSGPQVSVAKTYRVYHNKENLERYKPNKNGRGDRAALT